MLGRCNYHLRIHRNLDIIQTILALLSRARVSLIVRKCLFFEDRIDYLAYVIQPRRFGILTKATDAMRGQKQPTIVTEIKSYLGLCNVFIRFVPNFGCISELLNCKLGTNQCFCFGRLKETEFEVQNTINPIAVITDTGITKTERTLRALN